MSSKVTRGIVSGLAGGIVFGLMMQMMNAPTSDGGSMPMIRAGRVESASKSRLSVMPLSPTSKLPSGASAASRSR